MNLMMWPVSQSPKNLPYRGIKQVCCPEPLGCHKYNKTPELVVYFHLPFSVPLSTIYWWYEGGNLTWHKPCAPIASSWLFPVQLYRQVIFQYEVTEMGLMAVIVAGRFYAIVQWHSSYWNHGKEKDIDSWIGGKGNQETFCFQYLRIKVRSWEFWTDPVHT